MMEVWVILAHDYEDVYVYGVYASESLAAEEAKRMNSKPFRKRLCYDYEMSGPFKVAS